jgi:hypothetical protein
MFAEGFTGGRGVMPPWRIAAAGATVVALALGLAFPAMSAAAIPESHAAASGHCDPVWFLGARGSGESANGYDGMGPPIDHMASVIASDLAAKGLRMGRLANPYNADSVSDLKPNATVLALLAAGNPVAATAEYIHTSVDRYDASMQQGIAEAEYDVGVVLADCPSAKIIMAGYSQGAVAVHDAENYLAKNNPAEFSHIAGTLLLGDPDRVPYTKAKLFGTSAASAEGLRVYLKLVRKHDVPDPATTANIANADDIVGDFALKHLLHASAAIAVHEDYAHAVKGVMKYEPVLDAAAHWVAAKIPGPAWGKAIEVPGIAALDAGGSADVTSVSCPSSGNCAAGGQYTNSQGQNAAFVVSEVNGTWGKAQTVPGTTEHGGIISISCASAGNCTAGGANQYAFVVSEVNGTWGKASVVRGAAAAGIVQSSLNSVSCGSPGNCSAGGFYSSGGASEAFVVTQTGGTWGRLKEVPGTAALNTDGDAVVTSVSCGSAGNCSAGGGYQDAGGNQVFVVTQTGGRWGKAIEVPGSAALNTSGDAVFNSVSCAAAGNCSAVGDTAQTAFVVSQVHGTWHTAIKVHGIPSGELASVSCASPGNCSAGGYYGASDGTQAFVVNQTDGTWGTATNVPGTSGIGDKVTTISCESAGNCSAGGDSTSDQAFVVNQTDGIWGTATVVRGLGTGGSLLWSVSCPPAGNCAAGGAYGNPQQAFVVSESGGQ